MQCFDLCPAQYRFKYHLGIASPEATPFYFTFGKLVHRIIEEHTRAKGEKTLGSIKSALLSGQLPLEGNDKCPPLPNDAHLKLNLHLGNYARLAEKIGYDGEIEWPFYYDINPPHQMMIKGFIDRLIMKKDSAYIIDYKTTKPSRWRKDSSTIAKDLQLACYCWVVHHAFGIPASNIKAALYYLEDALLVPVRFSEATLSQVPTRLQLAYTEIQTADADKVWGNVGEHCRRCDYRKLCPHYNLV